jgi:predicted nucleic acid-binding protein
MRGALDTNVVIRLVTGEPPAMADAARALLERAESHGHRLLVSDLVVAECFHALRHHFGVPAEEAAKHLAALLSDPAIEGEAAGDLLATPASAVEPPGFMDRLILAHAARQGATLRTFDAKLAGLPGAERIRPRGG